MKYSGNGWNLKKIILSEEAHTQKDKYDIRSLVTGY